MSATLPTISANLFAHQTRGVEFLSKRSGAALFWEMGTGKTRTSLVAASRLYARRRIDRVVVFVPAAVKFSWKTELEKLQEEGYKFSLGEYDQKKQLVRSTAREASGLPIILVSYALLPQDRHVDKLSAWAAGGNALMICDESSFLKNHTAKQTKGANEVGKSCMFRWLLTGTPIANSPLDLFGQGLVMFSGLKGALAGFKNWYHFRALFGILKTINMGERSFQQVVGYQNVEELQQRFAPYVSRLEKRDCLDLPEKTYIVREVRLSDDSWKIYQELKKEAMLALPDSEALPEPNAAVRLLRLAQLTSGHVGVGSHPCSSLLVEELVATSQTKEVSSEKIDWIVGEITEGELVDQNVLVIWTRWVKERERLAGILSEKILVYEIHGGQTAKGRDNELSGFTNSTERRVLLAQPHAGGFGLNLTVASTAVFCSNDFSYTTRIQAEDRIHRIGQYDPCTYVDVVAVGPSGQKTIDAYILEALKNKGNIAALTCSAWREILSR